MSRIWVYTISTPRDLKSNVCNWKLRSRGVTLSKWDFWIICWNKLCDNKTVYRVCLALDLFFMILYKLSKVSLTHQCPLKSLCHTLERRPRWSQKWRFFVLYVVLSSNLNRVISTWFMPADCKSTTSYHQLGLQFSFNLCRHGNHCRHFLHKYHFKIKFSRLW